MKGYRRHFAIEGLNMERLIRQAGDSGLRLQGLRRKGRRITGTADEAELIRLQELADQGGWRLTHGRRVGVGRAADMLRKRMLLAAGCLLACAAVMAASQMMWRIDILDGGVYEADIRAYLTEQGIRPVCWKRKVDPAALRDELEWRYPKVAWIEAGWRGMTLQLRVVEGAAAGESISTEGMCNVVASRDGIVTGVVTVAGTPLVEAGEIVRAGQTLIAGEERTAQGETRVVAARGNVMARVWDAAAVVMSSRERQTVYTGKRHETQGVALPWFDLWKTDDPGYEQEDVSIRSMPLGGIFLPLSIRYETHMEAHVTQKQRDMEQLKAEAGVAAMRKLRQKIGLSDDLVDKWVDYSMIESEQVCAVAYGERVIDIAVQDRVKTQ